MHNSDVKMSRRIWYSCIHVECVSRTVMCGWSFRRRRIGWTRGSRESYPEGCRTQKLLSGRSRTDRVDQIQVPRNP
jgi:hypothetical protein